MADGIKLRLGRGDMNVFRTDDRAGERVRVHVAGRHPAALCPSCARPSMETNGTGWRDVIDVVRTLVVTLSICVRRFVCANEDCAQTSIASHRGLWGHLGGWRSNLGARPQVVVRCRSSMLGQVSRAIRP